MLDKCSTCNEFIYGHRTHKCHPRYEVWGGDLETEREDSPEIFAFDAGDAAEQMAEIYDVDECPMLQGEVIRVKVALAGSDKVEQFVVSGEAVPQYNASQLEDETIDFIAKLKPEGFEYDAGYDRFKLYIKVVYHDNPITTRYDYAKIKASKAISYLKSGKSIKELKEYTANRYLTKFSRLDIPDPSVEVVDLKQG